MAINKRVYVVGGGTVSHVRNHLALAACAYGQTARTIAELCRRQPQEMDIELRLTRMADQRSSVETVEDLEQLVFEIVRDSRAKMVFFSPAVVDFSASLDGAPSGKYESRLKSGRPYSLELETVPKLVKLLRQENPTGILRKDLFLVGFKTTCGASEEEQYRQGLNLVKAASCNLVLANDTKTRLNMVITPEEAAYHVTSDRAQALEALVEMSYLRSNLTFTQSTVVAGEPIGWDSNEVPASLRAVVDHCIKRGAYKRFRGVTAGHFAFKVDDETFITSRRKTDFNDMKNVGLVKVRTSGPDTVVAYGSKPSVGGQSQRIVFRDHPGLDCIVHFHCPKQPGSAVPSMSQREFECGSHQCGKNTSDGLAKFGNLSAVYLDNHGPNIVFNRQIDPAEVIAFIEQHFNLEQKSGGYAIA